MCNVKFVDIQTTTMTTTTAKTTTKASIIDVDANAIISDGLPTKKPIAGTNQEETNHSSNEKPTTTTTTSGSSADDIDCTNKDYVASTDCTKVSF